MLWIALLISIAMAATAIGTLRLRTTTRAVERCRRWEPVTGSVIATRIDEVRIGDGGYQYIPMVTYRYVVDGMQYECEHRPIGGHVEYSLRRTAERRMARYAAGQPVQIRINPLQPAESALECTAPIIPTIWAMLVLVWIGVIVGLVVLLTPGIDGPNPMIRL